MKKNGMSIIIYVVMSCLLMAFVEVVVEPSYLIKSLIKIFLFFGIPYLIMRKLKIKILKNFKINKKEFVRLLTIGISIYVVGIITYLILRNFVDFSKITSSLLSDQHLVKGQFILVALYISFGNSILEEFFFRLVSFIKLREYYDRKLVYLFSAFMFSIYHAAMIGLSFPLPLTLLSLVGLFVLGLLFNFVDEKDKNIYNSWFVHMFADFAIMTVGFIHL